MDNRIIMSTITAAILTASSSCNQTPPQLGTASIDEVIAAMTIEEKALMLIGAGMDPSQENTSFVGSTEQKVPGAAGITRAIPRLGIPSIVLADGPAGLRIKPIREGDKNTYYCTAFPIGTTLSSTWNTELVQKVGESIGNEVLEYGVDVILSPGANIHRNPLCGRNFEYYSEDPLLAGKTAAALINGIQSNGVGTSIKHFAVNNQETNRMNNDARLTQRALREIYLRQFQIAIRESNPWTVMTSYNYINGRYSSENRELVQNILRDEWKYEGLVMTDWFAGKDPVNQVISGNDLLMPGVNNQYEKIVEGMKNGTLKTEYVDANIKRILELVLKSPTFKQYQYSNKPNLEEHAKITRQAAGEGIVLLTNKNNALPIKGGKAALFGVTSYTFFSGGTGSGDVNEAYTVSLCEGLENQGFTIDEKLKNTYIPEIQKQKTAFRANPATKDSLVHAFVPEDFTIDDAKIKEYAKTNDVAFITLGRISGEFRDRRISNFNLSDNEKALLNSVSKAFKAAGKKTIVILNVGGVIETASWKDIPDAILLPWMGGQEGGNAVADVITGAVNPSGRLPMSFPIDYFDVPGAKNFPYDFEANGRSMFGTHDDNQNTENFDYTNYLEDIFVGYRYYNTFGKKTSFPFGYGLSYSEFEFPDVKVQTAGGDFQISLNVKNTGKCEGKTVVELYAKYPESGLSSPKYELKAFAKTNSLMPGESQPVVLTVNSADLAYFDAAQNQWTAPAGEYTFYIGKSAEDIVTEVKSQLLTPYESKVNDVMKPKEDLNVMKN